MIAFGSAVIGFVLFEQIFENVVLPFHIETALILMLYFELGILIRDSMKTEKNNVWKKHV